MPSEIRHLTTLKRLVIPDMAVGGTIIEYLGNISSLSELSLSNCNFVGSIPETFGVDHPNLTTLQLIKNGFSGSIPDSIGQMSSLVTLDLSANAFDGPIPSFLGALPRLGMSTGTLTTASIIGRQLIRRRNSH
jgi:Leucine rich repeat